MKLLGKSWKYINEGNAHIVVQILDTDYVIRLIKEDERTTDPKSVYDHVNFVNLIMIPLLGNKFYDKEEAIEMSQYDLEQLSKLLLPYRPKNRIFKSELSQIAIKATNLSIVSTQCDTNFCIEIKPKEGFISSSLRKYSTCYYCLKQHLKLQTGAIRLTSKYCPLDLFSGERERMKLSLSNMINNAQNNFKIFKNGLLVYNEKSEQSDFDNILKDMNYFSELNQFLDFIIDILLSDINEPYIKLPKSSKICTNDKPNQCYESNNLNSNSFLYKLLQLQKMSDVYPFDMENERNKHSNYVTKLIEQLTTLDLDLNKENDKETFIKTTNPIHLALISAVAKDCSIMISFSTNFVENYPYVDTGNSKIFYKLAVTDLEPKSPNTLYKRKDTEKKMIEIYEKYKESIEKEH
ncbi:inositol-pentakisphosphate 2-kinase isoform X1 [Spodoptera litura]|uniref:Inositol-pentakisphosphate 2-kinase n=1 Tax=Spodoptera litura TaxID=69820 RepID=A0A9J7E027_SPOLT|nr:inositol-pentakisphosphate 2-kinase isoform X1 [Spodoptera litura]